MTMNEAPESIVMTVIDRQDVSHRINVASASRQKQAIEAHVLAELRRSAYAPVRRVSCDFHEGVLTLRGQVPSYYLKQIAQTVVLHLSGADTVINNRLEVVADHIQ